MPKDQTYLNKEQDRRIDSIENSLKTLNKEMGEVRLEIEKVRTEMANVRTEFTSQISEVIKKVVELKASKKETIYALIVPLMTAMISALSVYILTR